MILNGQTLDEVSFRSSFAVSSISWTLSGTRIEKTRESPRSALCSSVRSTVKPSRVPMKERARSLRIGSTKSDVPGPGLDCTGARAARYSITSSDEREPGPLAI